MKAYFQKNNDFIILLSFFLIFSSSQAANEENGITANVPNSRLKGLSKQGRNVERTLDKDVQAGRIHFHQVQDRRRMHLNRITGLAQAERNRHKRNEIALKSKLEEQKKKPFSFSGKIETAKFQYLHKKEINKKEKAKIKIKDVALDTNVHQEHGHISEEHATYLNKHDYPLSHQLGYNIDGRNPGSPLWEIIQH